MTEKYACDQCGACCQGHLIVEADWVDLVREPRLLEADRNRKSWPIEKALSDLEEPGKALILTCGCRCPFLDGENRCEIYPTPPAVCVAMEAGDEQCQAARKEAGLSPLQPVASARDPCECEQPGHFHSGVPGVLAHVENGKVAMDAKVERCDACSRFPSDEAARQKLVELGLISEPEAASQRFIVHCFAVMRVRMPVISADNHKMAAEQAIDDFDWNRLWASAEFTDEFTEFLVDVEGDVEYAHSKRFDGDLTEFDCVKDPVVWLLSIRSELGQHTTVCASYESAKRELLGYVKQQWEAEFESQPLPDDADAAVRRYFGRSAESYDIQDVNVL